MSKYYGDIGYVKVSEISPGVWTESDFVKLPYAGDVVRLSRRFENGESVNDNLNVNHRFSIVSDPYALEHMNDMRWIEWMGSKWKITEVEVEHPRLIISVGGVYNG